MKQGMENMRTERITEMEGYLRECSQATDSLTAELDRMEAPGEHMTRLFAYYGSEAWYEDRDAQLPENVPAGVLSEDSVYDEITAIRDASFRMLAPATDILKNRL